MFKSLICTKSPVHDEVDRGRCNVLFAQYWSTQKLEYLELRLLVEIWILTWLNYKCAFCQCTTSSRNSCDFKSHMYSTYRPVHICMYNTKLYCKLAVRLCTAQTSCLFCTARSQYMYSMHIIPLLEVDRFPSRLPKVLRSMILPVSSVYKHSCRGSNPGRNYLTADA